MDENIIGTRIGIYDVISESIKKTADGHKMYHVKCSICGWETDMRKSGISKAQICKHFGREGKYII